MVKKLLGIGFFLKEDRSVQIVRKRDQNGKPKVWINFIKPRPFTNVFLGEQRSIDEKGLTVTGITVTPDQVIEEIDLRCNKDDAVKVKEFLGLDLLSS